MEGGASTLWLEIGKPYLWLLSVAPSLGKICWISLGNFCIRLRRKTKNKWGARPETVTVARHGRGEMTKSLGVRCGQLCANIRKPLGGRRDASAFCDRVREANPWGLGGTGRRWGVWSLPSLPSCAWHVFHRRATVPNPRPRLW